MSIKVIENPITVSELKAIAKERFGDMVKAVVDVEKEIMAVGGELHADEEALLLERGSKQDNLWGINLYPERTGDPFDKTQGRPERGRMGEEFIEFDSMINVRPSQGNRSRDVESEEIRGKIRSIVSRLIRE